MGATYRYLCACIVSKHFARAARLADVPIYAVAPPTTGLTPLSLLTYFYYS